MQVSKTALNGFLQQALLLDVLSPTLPVLQTLNMRKMRWAGGSNHCVIGRSGAKHRSPLLWKDLQRSWSVCALTCNPSYLQCISNFVCVADNKLLQLLVVVVYWQEHNLPCYLLWCSKCSFKVTFFQDTCISCWQLRHQCLPATSHCIVSHLKPVELLGSYQNVNATWHSLWTYFKCFINTYASWKENHSIAEPGNNYLSVLLDASELRMGTIQSKLVCINPNDFE